MESFLLVCVLALIAGQATTQDQSLPVVHVIPHSHCDAGYRESFQQYYDGQVHHVIDSMLVALASNSSRKFVWEETSFLSLWWQKATFDQKVLMKRLIDEKRLEMIGGGWTMHDEAVNNAATIIHQMTLGLNFLKDNLNVRPKHEWHIDPFGHSLMMPELYSALKYDGIVLNRIPDPIKQRMRKDQTLEFMWSSTFTNATIFTHVLDMHYSTPNILGTNVSEKAISFAGTCNERLKWYRSNQLLIPFGGDFNFQNATQQFLEMEEIMDYINQRPDVFKLRMQFSTLEDYFRVLLSMNPQTFPQLTDVDFFPYIACYPCYSKTCGGVIGSYVPCGLQTPDGYWSGFYTSKPAQKLLAREQEAATTALSNLNVVYPYYYEDMEYMSDYYSLQALMTHHDAITGTSFPPAYNDYNDRLNESLSTERIFIGALKNFILCNRTRVWDYFSNYTSLALANLNDSNVGVIAVLNPLLATRSEYVAIKLPQRLCVKIVKSSSGVMDSQQVGTTLYVPMTIGPLELQTLFLSKTVCPPTNDNLKLQDIGTETFSNGYLKLSFDKNNHITSMDNIAMKESINLTLDFNEEFEKMSSTVEIPNSVCDGSNVYTYVPDSGSKSLSPYNVKFSTVVSSGPLLWEIQQQISGPMESSCPINRTVRLFKPIGEDTFYQHFIEVQNTVGPLEQDYPNSVLLTVNTSLNTDSKFTTYTSGLYPMTRQYNYSKSSQANFYPLVGRASISDDKIQTSIVVSTKRPMAVSGKEGTLDLLIHRRIQLDNDPRGNDSSVMDDPIYIGIVPTIDVNDDSYDAMTHSQSPFTAYASIISSLTDWDSKCTTSFSPVKNSLPKGVKLLGMQILSLPPSEKYKVGMRLVYIDDGSVLIDLSHLFADMPFVTAEETTPDFGIYLGTLTSGVIKLTSYKLASVVLTLEFKPL